MEQPELCRARQMPDLPSRSACIQPRRKHARLTILRSITCLPPAHTHTPAATLALDGNWTATKLLDAAFLLGTQATVSLAGWRLSARVLLRDASLLWDCSGAAQVRLGTCLGGPPSFCSGADPRDAGRGGLHR